MKFVKGKDREQIYLFPISIEQSVDIDNEVRIIDLFVDSLNISDYGFKVDYIENGRPAYHPADLLKLFIYGYLNKTRSSRDLEKECKRNIEVMWLLKGLVPDHNTISNFRRDNSKAIKKVFRATVKIAKHFELIGGKLIAGDSTKLRAQNSKKNNYNQSKVERHLEYIDKKLEEYNRVLAEEDNDNKELITKEIEKQQERRQKYENIQNQIDEIGEAQVSTSDTESRQMIVRNNITEVVYNVQTTTDAKHNIPIDYKVTNNNDSKAMGNMLRRAKSILRTTDFTALYDKGYHTGSELKIAQDLGINAIVAIPEISSNAPNTKYNVANFKYNKEEDTYTCPENKILRTNGRWYLKSQGKYRTDIRIKQYKTSACKNCNKITECTKNTRNRGRVIERNEYASNIEQNKINVKTQEKLYKRRQAIVEHPYGTIKRQWGYSYILTKQGKERASSDVGFMFIAYNLKRLINILSPKDLKEYLKTLVSSFFDKKIIIKLQIRYFGLLKFFIEKIIFQIFFPINSLKFLKLFNFEKNL